MTSGEAADCKAYDALIGLPERAPDALLADKGYDADAIRSDLAKRKIEAGIPGRSNRRVEIGTTGRSTSSATALSACSAISRSTAIATRYDQLASSFLGMIHIATARYWIKFVHAP